MLTARGSEVWICSLPGYHVSDELPAGFRWTLETAAAAVVGSMRAQAAGRVHLVGHSLGGSVALTIAANFPDVVETLTLVGMVPAPPNENFRSMLLHQLTQGFVDDDTKNRCMDAWYGTLSPDDRRLLSRGFEVPFSVLGPSGLAAMEGVPADLPARVQAPLLVLVGTGDKVRTPDQVRDFVSAAPSRRLAAIPESGHSVHWEQPAACAAALVEFWSQSGAATRKMSDI